MTLHLKKILNLLFELSCLGIVFFVPIYFALFLKNNSVFELNKLVLFKIFVLLAAVCFFSLLVLDPSSYLDKFRRLKKEDRILLFLFLGILAFYIFSLAMSLFFSVDIEKSWFGSYNRRQGMETILYYILFFVLLFLNLNSNRLRRLIYGAVLSSLFMCVYGLVQYFGLDPLSWMESTQMRITSTTGQPNIFAANLLLMWPLTIYLFLSVRRAIFKIFLFVLLAIQVFCLFQTYSLSAALGLGGASLVTLFVFLYQGFVWKRKEETAVTSIKIDKRKVSAKKILTVAGVFLVILIPLFFTFQTGNNWILRQKLNSFMNLNGGSTSVRLDLYKISLGAIGQKIWFGYGLENQDDALVPFYRRDFAIHNNVNVMHDRAHNIFLDTLLTSGLLGLVAYLSLFLFFIAIVCGNIYRGKEIVLNYAILFAAIAYFVSLLFNFSFVVGEFYFWMLLAMAISLRIGFLDEDDEINKEEVMGRGRIFLISFFILFMAAVFVLSASKQVKILAADFYFREFLVSQNQNLFFKSLEYWDYINELGIQDEFYKKEMAFSIAANMPVLRTMGKAYWLTAENLLRSELYKYEWTGFSDQHRQAIILAALAGNGEDEYYQKAENILHDLIDISPEMPKLRYALAHLYFQIGEYEKSIDAYQAMLDTLPDTSLPEMNIDHRRAVLGEKYNTFIGRGDAFLGAKRYDEAIKDYQAASAISGDNFEVFQRISDVYLARGDFDGAIVYYKKIGEKYPFYYEWPLNIARVYEKKKDLPNALKYAKIAKMLYHDSEEIEELIGKLEGGSKK